MSKTYKVKELFLTLQGEGAQVGRAAVFIRFAGCSAWSGREEDRHEGPGGCSAWCDTDFRGGGAYSLEALLGSACQLQPVGGRVLAVLTGGEPGLQVDQRLVDGLHDRGFEVAIETNGWHHLPAGIDHITWSPKPVTRGPGGRLFVRQGHALKLIHPQPGLHPSDIETMQGIYFDQWFLQPMDGPDREANLKACVAYCLAHPRWRLSLQTHKLLGIP